MSIPSLHFTILFILQNTELLEVLQTVKKDSSEAAPLNSNKAPDNNDRDIQEPTVSSEA